MTDAAPQRLLATRADAWALLALIVAVVIFCAPLFAHPGSMRNPENGDTLNYYLHLELDRRSIIDCGQFPWWTPFVRGGIPLVGHPRDVSLSPVVLPALVLSPIEAVKVICLGIYLVGALGMYYLTRGVMGLGRVGSLAASVLLVTAAWLPSRLIGGNYDEWHLVLFPLVLAFFLRSREHWRYLIYGAFVLYVTIIDGKYIIAIFGLYLGLIAVAHLAAGLARRGEVPRARRTSSAAKWMGRLAALFALAAVLATAKIVPMVQMMRAAAKGETANVIRYPAAPWEAGRLGLRPIESGVNLGTSADDIGTWWAAVALFVLGCTVAPRRMLGWLLLLALTLLLMSSQLVPRWLDLFALLHRLPVFDALSKPFKYFNFFVLFILCLGVAHALTWLAGKKVPGTVFAAVLAALAAGVPYVWHIQLQARVFNSPVDGPPVKLEDDFYSLVAVDPREVAQRGRMFKDFFFVREGVGVLNWYDPMPLPCHAEPRYGFVLGRGYLDNPRYRGEAFTLGGAHCVIRQGEWGPLTITVDTKDLSGPDTLVINQNYNRRWRSLAGEVVNEGGRLAVRLPADARVVRLTYRPTDHYAAAGVSAAAFVACIAALILEWRKRRRNARGVRENGVRPRRKDIKGSDPIFADPARSPAARG